MGSPVMSEPIKVVFFDSGFGIAEALSSLLGRHHDLWFAGCYKTPGDLIGAVLAERPDVVVIHYELLPRNTTRGLLDMLLSASPEVKVVMWFEEPSSPPTTAAAVERSAPVNLLIEAVRHAAGRTTPSAPPAYERSESVGEHCRAG
jgi:hypothetical protein